MSTTDETTEGIRRGFLDAVCNSGEAFAEDIRDGVESAVHLRLHDMLLDGVVQPLIVEGIRQAFAEACEGRKAELADVYRELAEVRRVLDKIDAERAAQKPTEDPQ